MKVLGKLYQIILTIVNEGNEWNMTKLLVEYMKAKTKEQRGGGASPATPAVTGSGEDYTQR